MEGQGKQMKNLWIKETRVNKTKGYQFGSSEWVETSADNLSTLFKQLQCEYGRCISRMYTDGNGHTTQYGWVFLKRARYEDTREVYLQETWVSVSLCKPKRIPEQIYPESPWEGQDANRPNR